MPVTTKPARQTGADAGTRVDPAGPAVLLVKISSLGDVLHALPAVTDAARTVPGIRIDWVVEESFAEIPAWHPGVRRVIPVASRRWRSRPQDLLRGDALRVLRAVRRERYARVIDAQGLMKSALFAVIARGPRSGLAGRGMRRCWWPTAGASGRCSGGSRGSMTWTRSAAPRWSGNAASPHGHRGHPGSPQTPVPPDLGGVYT